MGEIRIIILLPVYNGARFLPAQLDSLLSQTFSNILVLCRDDGSSDDSLAILADYAHRFSGKFEILESRENLGACGSFSLLMQTVIEHQLFSGEEKSYVALCDQDDIWHRDKLAICLQKMLAFESGLEQPVPLAIHSDLRVVDEQGNEMAGSFMLYQGLNPGQTNLAQQALSNTITGCTTLLNEALLRKALPVPEKAIMHDWWLAMTTSAFGKIVYIDRALVDYRQHGNNTIGAREYRADIIRGSLWRRALDNSNREDFFRIASQCEVFEKRFARELPVLSRLRLQMITRVFRAPVLIRKIAFRLLRWT